MALQKINWTQIDTEVVPSGSIIDIGQITGPLHAGYFENLYISGQTIADVIAGSGTDALNLFTASINQALETTGSNLTVKGNLLVKGTTTAINSTTVAIGDNVIELNGTEAGFGGLLVKDPTAPNTISGSLLWDTTQDKWIGGPLGNEEGFIQDTQFNNFSSSVSTTIDEIGIWRETGSFYATTHDLQMTGSVIIKGDLRVEGTTTLVQTLDPNLESLVVSGAMNIVETQINSQIVSASLKIKNLGTIGYGSITQNNIIDCGDSFF
jgi:hypothetical protein